MIRPIYEPLFAQTKDGMDYYLADGLEVSEDAKQLAIDVNAATTQEEAKELAKKLQDLALSEYREYPLTYTNYVMVSQKNVTGLDTNSVVPEFIDYLTLQVD